MPHPDFCCVIWDRTNAKEKKKVLFTRTIMMQQGQRRNDVWTAAEAAAAAASKNLLFSVNCIERCFLMGDLLSLGKNFFISKTQQHIFLMADAAAAAAAAPGLSNHGRGNRSLCFNRRFLFSFHHCCCCSLHKRNSKDNGSHISSLEVPRWKKKHQWKIGWDKKRLPRGS